MRHELGKMSQEKLAKELAVSRGVIVRQELRGRRQIERIYDYALKWYVEKVLGRRIRVR